MRIDPAYTQNLVASLSGLTASQAKISQEISSGVRLTTLADDPAASGENLNLLSAIASADTFVRSVSTVSNRLQAADTALSSTVTALTNAISLAVQGNNGTQTPTNLKAIAQQLASARDTVLSMANSSYQGSYLFAGSAVGTQPFTLTSSTSPASITYSGDGITQSVTGINGQQLPTSVAGSQLFGTGSSADVFQALNQLIADFSSGTAAPSSSADLVTLHDSLSNLSQQRSILNASQVRLSAAGDYAASQETNLQAARSTLISADTASLATQLSAVTAERTALYSTIAIDKKGNLFDYL